MTKYADAYVIRIYMHVHVTKIIIGEEKANFWKEGKGGLSNLGEKFLLYYYHR